MHARVGAPAVDAKIEEQRNFVAWWDDHVTPRQSPGRSGNKSNADTHLISVPAAEKRYGIIQPQVSKWRSRLKDEEAYREQQRLAMWAKRDDVRELVLRAQRS